MAARWELHGVNLSGPTYTVGLMLALLGEPFDYVHVDVRGGAHKHPDYVARQRYGQVPLLVDRDTGAELTQSAAILMHLADATGRMAGTTPKERSDAREWLFWTWDHLARGIYRVRASRAGFVQFAADVVAHYGAEGPRALTLLDKHLAGRAWMVGAGPTIADVAAYGVVAYAEGAGYDLGDHPAVKAWTDRIAALPGFKGQDALLPGESRAAA